MEATNPRKLNSAQFVQYEMELEKTIFNGCDEYGSLIVKEQAQIRSLHFGDGKKQSVMLRSHPSVLVLYYTQAMMCSLLFNSKPTRILMLGLGGGSLVHFLFKVAPLAQIDVVELRPQVIEISKTFFKLPGNDCRLTVHCMDAAQFVTDSLIRKPAQYDLILVDVFDDSGPSGLVRDKVFLKQCKGLLTDKGVIAFNLWNRREDTYTSLRKLYNYTFERNLLELKMGYVNNNVVLLAFSSKVPMNGVIQFQTKAQKLKQQYGIDFPLFLELLQKQNFTWLSRMKKLIQL